MTGQTRLEKKTTWHSEDDGKRIQGTSRMSEAIRCFDWARTPLGALESWSPELVTVVNQMLLSQLMSCLIVGPGQILIYNDLYESVLTGKPQSLGRSFLDVWAEARTQAEAIISAPWKTGKGTLLERVSFSLFIDGAMTERICSLSNVPIWAHRGCDSEVIAVFQTVIDHTDGIRAERELRESETRLTQSYAELQAIYDGGATAGALIDAKTFRYLRVNRKLAEMLGQPAEMLIGISVFDLASDVSGLRSQLEAVAAGASLIGVIEEGELSDGSGEYRTWQSNYVPVRSPEGEIMGIAAASIEITNLRKAEAALVKSEKLAIVGKLSSSIAHEINNPIDAAMNLLYIMRDYIRDEEAISLLDTADGELRRVVTIVNETLRFHQQNKRVETLSSSTLFHSVLAFHAHRIRDSQIQVNRRDRFTQPFEGVESELRQVLYNLVANALDAMEAAGRLFLRSRPAFSWASGQRGVAFTIADDGAGMDGKTLARAFDAFFTTKGIGRTGLGLWITTEIVASHGGHVRIRTRKDAISHGSVFVVFLPIK